MGRLVPLVAAAVLGVVVGRRGRRAAPPEPDPGTAARLAAIEGRLIHQEDTQRRERRRLFAAGAAVLWLTTVVAVLAADPGVPALETALSLAGLLLLAAVALLVAAATRAR